MGNNEIIEKAKQWQVGDESTDKHGVTYYVHAINAAGKPLWRKKKDGGGGANTNNSSSTGRGNNSVKSSSSEQAVDISKIPDKEFKRITNMLEKQNPLAKDAPRYLEEEAMSDSELKNFLACAEHFKNDTKNINQLTRQRCSEWAKLAKSELDNRRQEVNGKQENDNKTNSVSKKKAIEDALKDKKNGSTTKSNQGKTGKDFNIVGARAKDVADNVASVLGGKVTGDETVKVSGIPGVTIKAHKITVGNDSFFIHDGVFERSYSQKGYARYKGFTVMKSDGSRIMKYKVNSAGTHFTNAYSSNAGELGSHIKKTWGYGQ